MPASSPGATALSVSNGPTAAERQAAVELALSANDPLLAVGAFARAAAHFDDVVDERATDAFLDRVVSAATHPLVQDHARAARAERAAQRGDFSAADADLDALGEPRELLCIGPFANTGGAALGTPTPADDVVGTIDSDVAGLDRTVRWRVVPREAAGGFDVGNRFVARRDVRALCAVVVDVPRAGPVAVRVGTSGGVVVRAGARSVLTVARDRPVGFDQDAAVVVLPRGKSIVVLEAGFRARGGMVRLRLTGVDGRPMAFRTSTSAAAFRQARLSSIDDESRRSSVLAHATIDDVLVEAAPSAVRLEAAIALAQRTRAFDEQERPPALEKLLETLLGSPLVSPASRTRALVQLAVEKGRRDPTAARKLYEDALAQDPTSGTAMAGLASLRAALGDDVGARRAFAEAVRLAPDSVRVRQARVRFERDSGLFPSTTDADIVEQALHGNNDDDRGLAAEVLTQRGDRRGAVELLAQGGDATRRALETSALRQGELGSADVSSTSKVLLNSWVEQLRLRLRMRQAAHTVAERLLPLLVELDPSGEQARSLVAERRRLFPERAEPLTLAARLALLQGDRTLARQLMGEALALTPEDGDLRRMVAAISDVDDDALAVRWLPVFDDAQAARARADVPPDGALLGGWMASRTLVTRFFENGLLRSYEDVVVVVDDAKKADGFRTFSFPYSGGRDQVDVLVAERVRADGRREPAERIVDRGQDGKENGAYSDARGKVVVFAGIDDGDVLHVRVRKEAVGQQNLFGDFFGDIEVIQGRFPVRRFRYIVEAPLSRPLSWGGRRVPEPVVQATKDTRVYDFVVDDVAGLDGEDNMPPWLEQAAYLSVSTYSSWGELGRWYEDLIADQLRLNDELRGTAARIKAEATSEADLVRRIYEYVVTNTRYVGIELGIHGWKPYPVTEVHRRRFGDCKDKASLLVVLLKEAGVDAHLALVRTIQLGHAASSPPSMWAFNHAIAWVPKLDLFLDGTAERSGWRELPSMDQGALALVVDGAASRLVTIPEQGADDNRNTSDYTLRLRDDGSLAVEGQERFKGQANASRRQELADPGTRRLLLERQLAQGIPGAKVESVSVTPLGLDAEWLGYDFKATFPARAAHLPDGSWSMPLSLFPHNLTGGYAEQSTRRFAVFVDHPWRTRNVMRYVLPPGTLVPDLPMGGRVDGTFIRFVQTVTRTADGFVVDEDTALLARRIEPERYQQFRQEALAADRLMKRTIRLVAEDGR